jgi:hypothetical protein
MSTHGEIVVQRSGASEICALERESAPGGATPGALGGKDQLAAIAVRVLDLRNDARWRKER